MPIPPPHTAFTGPALASLRAKLQLERREVASALGTYVAWVREVESCLTVDDSDGQSFVAACIALAGRDSSKRRLLAEALSVPGPAIRAASAMARPSPELAAAIRSRMSRMSTNSTLVRDGAV